MVKGLRLAPATRTTSASPMSPAAVSVPKPPATPRYPSPCEEVQRQGGSGGQRAEAVGELPELRAGAGEVRTAAGEDQRPLRPGEQAGHLPEAAVDVVRHRRCRRRGSSSSPASSAARS